MEFGYLRVDFLPVNGADCVFCHRHLRSAKGIVVVDRQGVEYFAGPSCAKRELGPPDERILDVARLALLVVADIAAAAPVNGAAPKPVSSNQKLSDGRPSIAPSPSPAAIPVEVQYLRLRFEAMGRFKGNVSQVMRNAYQTLQELGELDAQASKFLSGLIRNACDNNTIFSPNNIRRCIGIEHWLQVALEQTKPDRRTYLNSMLDKLHRFWMLTEGQISAINRWGEGIRRITHDFPVLDVKAFSGVKRPDFMNPSRPRQ